MTLLGSRQRRAIPATTAGRRRADQGSPGAALLNPVCALPAPPIGTVVGLLAGAYPALRAARTSPLAALRHI